jgi:hypothetical protein
MAATVSKVKLEDCKCDRPKPYSDVYGHKTNICEVCKGLVEGVSTNRRVEYEKKIPPYSSRDYPNWVCKGGCEGSFPENTPHKKCPTCMKAPLVRWLQYEQRQ